MITAADRQALVESGHFFFQRASQKSDLLDSTITQDCLIEHLAYVAAKGYHFEFTAIKTDHDDDSALGEHCHFNGFCVDGWPLTGPTPGTWLDAGDPFFQRFLRDVASSPYLHQIGLAGSAFTDPNVAAAGSTCFQDSGDDHVHLGSQS